MKSRHLGVAVLVSGLFLLVATIPATCDDKEEGFVSLFNGKDLTGWRYGKSGAGENKAGKGYQAENGILFCTKADGGNLFTEKEYGDFIFRFELKIEENGNNGVGIRAPLEGDAAYVGMEIQILDDYGPAYKDKLQPWQYHGSIYNVVPAKRGSLKPAGEWNTEEIYAKGGNIKVTLNGNVIVDANLDVIEQARKELADWSSKHSQLEAALPELSQLLKRFRDHPGLARTKGHIGFLGHGARVEFRNLRIKEL